MTPANVRARRRQLEADLAIARAEVRKVKADMDALEEICDHKKAVVGSHMGESCRHCPDCGGHDV